MHVMTAPMPRDERGAVAVMVAMLVLVLFGISALAVDLGSAWVVRRNAQADTDLATLAGGGGENLPKTATGTGCSKFGANWNRPAPADQAIVDTASYLTEHRSRSVSLSGSNPTTAVTASQLVDCDFANGEAAYGKWSRTSTGLSFTANQNQLSVFSPGERVDFALGNVLGQSGVVVAGQATVEIKTQLLRTLPLYAFTGCDYGQQTIAQPTNGHSSEGVTLAFPDDKNTKIGFTLLGVNPVSSAQPPAVTLNASAAKVVITGTDLDKVTKVGFFRSSSSTPPAPIEVAKPNPLTTDWTLTGTTQLSVTIPTTVTSIEDTWFVRLYGPSKNNGTDPLWTPIENNGNADKTTNLAAFPFTVGSSTLSCAQGSTSGNFGTLDLFNSSSGAPNGQDDNIAYNIAFGLQYGLAPYPQAKWTPPLYQCVNGQDGVAKTWAQEGTNCVSTKPGLPSNAAEAGFVTGSGLPGNKALLKTSANQCPHDWAGASPHMVTAPTGHSINNDVLTCYLLDTTTTVGQVSSATYPFAVPKLEQSIYLSPRFVLVPVLGKGPTSGSSNSYEIVDFRPGFISDQALTATRGSQPNTGNGLVWTSNNRLQAVKVIFLNPGALPDPPLDADGKYIPYVGNGKKHLLLVD